MPVVCECGADLSIPLIVRFCLEAGLKAQVLPAGLFHRLKRDKF